MKVDAKEQKLIDACHEAGHKRDEAYRKWFEAWRKLGAYRRKSKGGKAGV